MKNFEDKYWQRAGKVKGATYDRLNRDRVRVNVSLTHEMLDALKARAVRERRSVAGLIRYLAVQGLSNETV